MKEEEEEEEKQAVRDAIEAAHAALRRHEEHETNVNASADVKKVSKEGARRGETGAVSLGALAARLRTARRRAVAAAEKTEKTTTNAHYYVPPMKRTVAATTKATMKIKDVLLWEASADIALHAREPGEYLVVATALALEIYPALHAENIARANAAGNDTLHQQPSLPNRWREIAGALVIYFGICAPAPLELKLLFQKLPQWMIQEPPLSRQRRKAAKSTESEEQKEDAFMSAMYLLRVVLDGGQARLLLLNAWERQRASPHHRLLMAVAGQGACARMRRGIAASVRTCYRQIDLKSLAELLGLESHRVHDIADVLEAAGCAVDSSAVQQLRALGDTPDAHVLDAHAVTISFVSPPR